MKNIMFLKIVFHLGFTVCISLCISSCSNEKKVENQVKVIDSLAVTNKKKPIDSLSIEEIREIYKNNPCYLVLLRDSNYWEKGARAGFSYSELFNDSLPAGHPYANRFLVGDFNALNPDGTNRTVKEVYPTLQSLEEFKSLPADLILRMDTTRPGTPSYEDVKTSLKNLLGEKGEQYVNFLDKVWKYRLIPINRDYSLEGNNVYSAGQFIVMCEACKDTILMKGRFATSAKRQDFAIKTDASGKQYKVFYEYLPTKERRKYYAGLYRITSKNWETQRKYDSADIKRDIELGGGNNRVTFYKGSAELPNFLLMSPSKEYPKAMRANGIHEVALRELARGMLGTANSIGCLRVSDFGSKFLRWWVPQNTKLFVAYNDSLYHQKIKSAEVIEEYLPFKSQQEGDEFRKWINTYKPNEAKLLEIGETGNYKNGFIIDGYYYFKNEYDNYLSKQKQ